ncbi:MAG: hypothetical protein FD165_221 [Gammaproteobacteria bacterium]|nr:MAG: hypothetical protein FD165_221 [Gammaproteobacteria bacterium]TND06799.1 MAG: hypothetical protein FD120_531 [Gammaproteobacteria bacterium]
MMRTEARHAMTTSRYVLLLALLILALPGDAAADVGVQVGAYMRPGNAQQAVEKLRTTGFTNVTTAVKTVNGRSLHTAIVGPFEDRKKAEAARLRLRTHGWSGFITSFPNLPAEPDGAMPSSRGPIGALETAPLPTQHKPDDETRTAAPVQTLSPHAAVDDDGDTASHPAPAPHSTGKLTGYVSAELRLFANDPSSAGQHGDNLAWSMRPEYYRAWNDGGDSVIFTPFIRWDQHDGERSHADVNELLWQHVAHDWEARAGIGKVFWGVTESQHLVDIINQTDLVENIDTEDKLGQPMINMALIRDLGNLNLFVLPGFRERTFPGPEGRLRTIPYVDMTQARYESGAEDKHVDVAVRWTKILGDWDIGLAHFSGTGRDPLLLPGMDGNGNPVLIPFYEQIDQTSLDLQAALDAWLWKLEVISRHGQNGRYTAFTGGLEYTFVGILETAADLGIIAEYLYDDRKDSAPTPFEDDVMIGTRLTFNDAQSSEFLVGAVIDADGDGVLYNLEASRRIGNRWKLGAEARIFSNIPLNSVLSGQRNDDYLQIELARYF